MAVLSVNFDDSLYFYFCQQMRRKDHNQHYWTELVKIFCVDKVFNFSSISLIHKPQHKKNLKSHQ